MREPTTEAEATQYRLWAARRRAGELQPFSPAWDAAMAGVEDLERQVSSLWRRVLTADGLSAHSDDMIAPFAA